VKGKKYNCFPQKVLVCLTQFFCKNHAPVRASLYYLKDDKMGDYIPDESSIAAFSVRVSGMIGSVCAEEFVAKPSFMGCQRCG
jgi:hypothetical protein